MILHTVESIPYLSVEMARLINLSGIFGPFCFKKNLNASEPSEHPLSKGEKYTVGGDSFFFLAARTKTLHGIQTVHYC